MEQIVHEPDQSAFMLSHQAVRLTRWIDEACKGRLRQLFGQMAPVKVEVPLPQICPLRAIRGSQWTDLGHGGFPCAADSDKQRLERTTGLVVRSDPITPPHIDRAQEGAGKHDLPLLQRSARSVQL